MATTDQLQAIEQRLAVIQQRMDDLIELNELLDKAKPRVSRTTLAAVKALPNKWRREAVSQCLMCCETSQQKADELEQVVKGENDGS